MLLLNTYIVHYTILAPTRSNQIELMKILLNYSPFFTHLGFQRRSSLWKWEFNLLLVVWVTKLIRFLFINRSCGIWKVNWSRLQRRNILHNQVRLSARNYKLSLLMLDWETGLRIYMLRRHKLAKKNILKSNSLI